MQYIDTYISELWNDKNKSERIVEENLWDFCRKLEEKGFLIGDDAAVSTMSIGPFKIASTLELKRRDLLMFFCEIIVPIIFTGTTNLPFDQVYTLYLLPAADLLLTLADNGYWIKDSLQWKILMYIKDKNNRGQYPTVRELKMADEFRGVEDWQMEEAVSQLKSHANCLGDKNELITLDCENRMKAEV